jgi:hypothetical protein
MEKNAELKIDKLAKLAKKGCIIIIILNSGLSIKATYKPGEILSEKELIDKHN